MAAPLDFTTLLERVRALQANLKPQDRAILDLVNQFMSQEPSAVLGQERLYRPVLEQILGQYATGRRAPAAPPRSAPAAPTPPPTASRPAPPAAPRAAPARAEDPRLAALRQKWRQYENDALIDMAQAGLTREQAYAKLREWRQAVQDPTPIPELVPGDRDWLREPGGFMIKIYRQVHPILHPESYRTPPARISEEAPARASVGAEAAPSAPLPVDEVRQERGDVAPPKSYFSPVEKDLPTPINQVLGPPPPEEAPVAYRFTAPPPERQRESAGIQEFINRMLDQVTPSKIEAWQRRADALRAEQAELARRRPTIERPASYTVTDVRGNVDRPTIEVDNPALQKLENQAAFWEGLARAGARRLERTGRQNEWFPDELRDLDIGEAITPRRTLRDIERLAVETRSQPELYDLWEQELPDLSGLPSDSELGLPRFNDPEELYTQYRALARARFAHSPDWSLSLARRIGAEQDRVEAQLDRLDRIYSDRIKSARTASERASLVNAWQSAKYRVLREAYPRLEALVSRTITVQTPEGPRRIRQLPPATPAGWMPISSHMLPPSKPPEEFTPLAATTEPALMEMGLTSAARARTPAERRAVTRAARMRALREEGSPVSLEELRQLKADSEIERAIPIRPKLPEDPAERSRRAQEILRQWELHNDFADMKGEYDFQQAVRRARERRAKGLPYSEDLARGDPSEKIFYTDGFFRLSDEDQGYVLTLVLEDARGRRLNRFERKLVDLYERETNEGL
jgi:hypothetical protein